MFAGRVGNKMEKHSKYKRDYIYDTNADLLEPGSQNALIEKEYTFND